MIVEDNLLVAEGIAALLRKHALLVAGICASGENAIDQVSTAKPDLVLMDVALAGKLDGIATAQRILSQNSIPIIYLSDHIDQATVDRAKETLPANYLSKPFQEPDLLRAIDIAIHNANANTIKKEKKLSPKHFFLRTNSQQFVKLAYDDILYIEADRAYSTVVTTHHKYKLAVSLNHVHDQIDHADFLRVHRSYVVNVNRITALDGNVIKLNEHQVQMNPDARALLMKHMKFIQ
nr:response regulator [Chryseolinea lacunae]